MDAKAVCDTFYLALTIYREARGEPLSAKAGVAWTVLNRMQVNPKSWGNSIDAVVTKKWQYSSLTDPKDPQLTRWPLLSDQAWVDCLACADEVLRGVLADPTNGSTHYHDISIAPPSWATSPEAQPKGKFGRINFYRLPA